MSRKCLIQREIKKTKLVQKYQSLRESLIKKIYDKKISDDERFKSVMKLSMLSRNSSKSRLRNRCAVTGRPRGYYRKFGLSRIMLRELAGKGRLPGVIKSSW